MSVRMSYHDGRAMEAGVMQEKNFDKIFDSVVDPTYKQWNRGAVLYYTDFFRHEHVPRMPWDTFWRGFREAAGNSNVDKLKLLG